MHQWCIISTDEYPSLRIESSAIINLRGVSTKLNKYICIHHANVQETYKQCIVFFGTPGICLNMICKFVYKYINSIKFNYFVIRY